MSKFLLVLLSLAALAANAQYTNRDGYTIWQGRMSVGTNQAAGTSSILRLGNANGYKSFVLPRVVSTDSVSSPEEGMFHYDMAVRQLYYRTNLAWIPVIGLNYLQSNYYTKANLQTSGQAVVDWGNVANAPPKVDSVTSNEDSTQLRYWIAGTPYSFYDVRTSLTGGDTTVFATVIDSTGQPGQRVLWSANNKIKSSPYFLFDSANKKVVIGHNQISVGGPNTKLFVKGNAEVTGQFKNGYASGNAVSDTTTWKPVAIDASGNYRMFTRWPGSGLVTGANNGLSMVGGNVQLGGSLTKADTITVNPYSLKIIDGSMSTSFQGGAFNNIYEGSGYDSYIINNSSGINLGYGGDFTDRGFINVNSKVEMYGSSPFGGNTYLNLYGDSAVFKALGTESNLLDFRLRNIPNTPTGYITYYNPTTGKVTYGTVPASGSRVNTTEGKPMPYVGTVIKDNLSYDAFPVAWEKGDTIYVASKNSPTHASGGYGAIYRSIDGGMHIDSIGLGTDSLVANYFAGQFDSTTTIYCFNGTDQQRLYMRRSVDGIHFTTTDSLILTGNDKGLFFTGNGVRLPSGRFLFPAYFLNTTTPLYECKIMYTDDGIHFGIHSTIYSGTVSKAEPSFEILSEGTTDGSTKMIAVIRNNGGGTLPEQYISTDGGITWTYQGTISAFGTESAQSPLDIKRWNGRIYLVKGVRKSLTVGGSYIGVSEALIDSALAGTTAWSTPSRLYDARWQYKASGIDFGYPTIFEYDNNLYAFFYDISQKSISGAPSSDRKTRMSSIKLFGNSFYERNRKTDQTIVSNTDVAVDFSTAVYSADTSWSSSDTAFKILRDGVYMIQASFTFPVDTTGSYRQGLLKLVDVGRNDTTGNQLLDKVTITGSDNLDFNRIKLTGVAYVHGGMLIKVFARHNATTSQDLVNTQIEQRAKIYIKKID